MVCVADTNADRPPVAGATVAVDIPAAADRCRDAPATSGWLGSSTSA
jgi:hypothetical protein